MANMIETALKSRDMGLSVVPIEPGTKKALVKWSDYQKSPMGADDIRKFFAGDCWFAIIAGEVSGNLELIDFDIPEKHGFAPGQTGTAPKFQPFCDLLTEHGHEELLNRLIWMQTKSGGMGLFYRCPDGVQGNQKLAERMATASELASKPEEKRKVLIETRGNGGYFLTYPTPGYKILKGKFASIPTITGEERELLHAAARFLSETDPEVYAPERSNPSTQRPGDEYNLKAAWDEILTKHGWQMGRKMGQRTGWTRPGKSTRDGISATTGNGPNDLLYVFTSSAHPFEPSRSYSKFAAYALLEHKGDYHFAAQTLKAQGYGTPPKQNGQPPPTHEREYLPRAEYIKQRESMFVSLADIEPEQVEWLFDRRFAKGMLSLIAGDPGEGKSTIARSLTAMLTTGKAPPFWGLKERKPRAVVWLTKEESLSHSVAPALKAMGADLSKVFSLSHELDEEGNLPPDFLLDDWGIQQLSELIQAHDAAMLVLDPLMAFFDAKTDVHRQNETRGTLSKLIQLGARTGCTPIGIVHQSKAKNANALLNIVGSIDFGAAARTAFMVGHDPDDKARKAIAQTKSNLGPWSESIGFEIKEDGAIEWFEESSLDADRMAEMPDIKAKRDKMNDCRAWLIGEINYGPKKVSEILAIGKQEGYGKSTVYSAADALSVSRGYEPSIGHRGAAWWGLNNYKWDAHQWPDPFEED
jgi:energy-coupling factor transporter ATP-binding protein EcfA2